MVSIKKFSASRVKHLANFWWFLCGFYRYYPPQVLSQRPVQSSSGRPIFSLDVEKYCQIQIALWEDPRSRPGPTISKFGLLDPPNYLLMNENQRCHLKKSYIILRVNVICFHMYSKICDIIGLKMFS